MQAEQADGSSDSPARAVLIEHCKLIRTQRISEEIGAGLKLLTGVMGMAIASAVVLMVWQASTERGLVIEAFSVPQSLAEKGLTGQVVASQLVDNLSALQAATESARAATTYSNDWGHDIKVEIPQTGVSISELQRYLRQWLGHQTRVGGEVFQTAEGLKLTVRAGGEAGDSVTGAEADLDQLAQKGAEALFARTQPYRYGVYLSQNGRAAEGKQVFTRLAESGPPAERAWALMGQALVGGSPEAALPYLRDAVAIDPNLGLAWMNLASIYGVLSQPDAALAAMERASALLRRPGRGGFSERAAAPSDHSMRAGIALTLGDYDTAAREYAAGADAPNYFGSREISRLNHAQTLAQNHDIGGARALLPPRQDDGALTAQLMKWESAANPNYAMAVALDDWPGALAQAQGLRQMFLASDAVAQWASGLYDQRQVQSTLAAALAHTGQFAEADALIAATPLDCDLCVRTRGVVAALSGRPANADRWFAEAVRRNAKPPGAYFEWAGAKLARGDVDGAITLLRQAIARGPRWADPLELLGEALMRRGDMKGAIASYREAVPLAPNWGRLHLRLGDALAARGKTDEARAEWRKAATLGLSAADRAALATRKP